VAELFQTAAMLMRLMLDRRIRASVAARELCGVERGRAGRDEGYYLVGRVVGMLVVGHCFEGGEAAHDLDQLHDKKHYDPDEL